MGGWEDCGGVRGLVKAGHMVPPGFAWLVKHSCHFVHLKVGLLAQVEKWKGLGWVGLAVVGVRVCMCECFFFFRAEVYAWMSPSL